MSSSGKSIYFFATEKEIVDFLANTPSLQKIQFQLISFQDRVSLEHSNISFHVSNYLTSEDRDYFLDQYKKVIRDLSSKDLLWNATHIASCNRFTSPLGAILEQIFIIEKAAANQADDFLVLGAHKIIGCLYGKKGQAKGVKISFLGLLGDLIAYFRSTVSFLRDVAAIVYKKCFISIHYSLPAEKNKKIDFLIKTFFYDNSIDKDGMFADPFFGCLGDFLDKRGNVCTVVSVAGNFEKNIIKLSKSKAKVFPIEAFISFKDIFIFFIMLVFYFAQRRENVFFCGKDISSVINFLSRKSQLVIPFYQVLHYAAGKNLSKLFSIGKIFYTYENNPWEKMLIASFRKFSPQTKLVGYQHAVIPMSAVNMFCYQGGFTPDNILTTGDVPLNILQARVDVSDLSMRPGCALRYQYLDSAQPLQRTSFQRILVVFEGVSAASALADYVTRELKDTQYHLVLRFHPVLPFHKMRTYMRENIEDCKNVSLSQERNLKDDLSKADVVVYWGSTTALEAALMGKFLIGYDDQRILGNDPLFELNDFKRKVNKEDSLFQIVQSIYSMTDRDFYAERDQATKYLKKYFLSVTEDRLREFILP